MTTRHGDLDRRKFLKMMVLGGGALATSGLLAACGGVAGAAVSKPSGGSGGQTPAAAGAKVVARLADNGPSDNPEGQAERFFAQRLGELTKGAYDLKVYNNAVLGPEDSTNEQLRNGTLQFGESALAYLSKFDKRLSIGSLPYLYTSQDKLYAALDGKLGAAIAKLIEGIGFKLIYFPNGGVRNVYNRKGAFTTPADFRAMNLRIRVQPDPVFVDTFNALGAKTVTMAFGEIYSALQQGVIDGAENSITYYMQAHHGEVAKYFTLTQHAFGMDTVIASLKWFNEQPAEAQKAILQAGKDAEAHERKLLDDQTKQLSGQANAAGVKISDCDAEAFKHAVQPVWDKYASQFGDLLAIVKETQ